MNLPLIGRIAVLVVIAIAVGLFSWRAMRSRILPHRVFLEGWWLVPTVVLRGRPWLVLAIALVIATGAGLQSLFMFFLHPANIQKDLPLIATVWQGVMAMLTAGLVAPIQMFVLERALLPPPGFTHRRSALKTAFFASWWGLSIWAFGFALALAVQALVFVSPAGLRIWIATLASIVSFVGLNLLALIRASLALGARNPLTTGVKLAAADFVPLNFLQAILLIPPAIVVPLCVHGPKLFFGPQDNTQSITIVLGTIFTVFQFLAVEVATTIFTRRADFVRHVVKPGEPPPAIFAPDAKAPDAPPPQTVDAPSDAVSPAV